MRQNRALCVLVCVHVLKLHRRCDCRCVKNRAGCVCWCFRAEVAQALRLQVHQKQGWLCACWCVHVLKLHRRCGCRCIKNRAGCVRVGVLVLKLHRCCDCRCIRNRAGCVLWCVHVLKLHKPCGCRCIKHRAGCVVCACVLVSACWNVRAFQPSGRV